MKLEFIDAIFLVSIKNFLGGHHFFLLRIWVNKYFLLTIRFLEIVNYQFQANQWLIFFQNILLIISTMYLFGRCGFAALSMVASNVGLDLHPDDLAKKAKLKNLTNHGELFSAEELAIFAQEILHMQFHVILKDSSIRGKCYEIKNYLLNNNLILIPYPFQWEL